ncbi:MAG: phosphonate ABC transporter ATP-binding protein [Chloroflexi bacterium]|nr:phosphonate ABC transporter ATP-binding protein [Chloroflexota bacterium]
MAFLEITDLTKRYGAETVALDGITLSVERGAFVVIIGPSGAGKSTLLRCINRMIDWGSGEIMLDGVAVGALAGPALRRHRSRIGMVFQHYNLVNRLSVLENVLHGRLGAMSSLAGVLGLYSAEAQQEALRIVQMLGLEPQLYKRCDQLSGGQKQRVGIGRALIQNPALLLCDEPIASLDPNAARVIMDTLAGINRTLGITVLVNLHQVDVALRYAGRIIGVNQGRVVYDGPPAGVTRDHIAMIYGAEADELLIERQVTDVAA